MTEMMAARIRDQWYEIIYEQFVRMGFLMRVRIRGLLIRRQRVVRT